MELVKSPPPAGKGGKPRVDWDAVVERLRSNPGVWGVLEDVSRSTATHIKMGRIKARTRRWARREAPSTSGTSGHDPVSR
jgi:hypothetical protein